MAGAEGARAGFASPASAWPQARAELAKVALPKKFRGENLQAQKPCSLRVQRMTLLQGKGGGGGGGGAGSGGVGGRVMVWGKRKR